MRKYRQLGTALIALTWIGTASSSGGPVKSELAFAPETDFSKFQHSNPNHSRLPCLLCHRRETNAAQPTLPGKDKHTPCTGCHAPQFASGAGPICTICHADVQAGTVKAFPPLRSFGSGFDHAKHVAVGGSRCSSCHRPANRGVALTIPIGTNAHNACFSCHAPQAKADGRDISSCGVCHKPEPFVRNSQRTVAYRRGFSHAHHDSSESLGCLDCHNIRAGQPQRKQVTAPIPLNHHAPARGFSCMTCHNGKRAFGGDDFTVCTRCHKGSMWRF
jgi:c(7)-type cytochrome triheme protein